jgi:hypothetical protein
MRIALDAPASLLELERATHQELTRTACCGRKKLPFAGYSVVKEREGLTTSAAKQTLVENTGLEPVTSWLQTRRSPS